MAWVYLILAGGLECVWAVSMRYSEGFSKPGFTALTLVMMIASFWLLSQAMNVIPIGTAYAVWTGIGAVGVAIFGMIWLGEPKDWLRLGSLLLVVLGILGLKMGHV